MSGATFPSRIKLMRHNTYDRKYTSVCADFAEHNLINQANDTQTSELIDIVLRSFRCRLIIRPCAHMYTICTVYRRNAKLLDNWEIGNIRTVFIAPEVTKTVRYK